MSIGSIFNISRNAMSVSQAAIQVTSSNIANVNTTGYARQGLAIEAAQPVAINNELLGSGVTSNGTIRYYDRYLEEAIREKNSDLNQQDTVNTYFQRIQSVLDENNSNLSTSITAFFNAWNDLSADPTSVAVRTTVGASGESLAKTVRSVYSGLADIQKEADQDMGEQVGEINTMLSSLADLNQKIFESNATEGGAGDLITQQTELVKELSAKIDITSVEDQYGRLTIMTGKGRILVDGNKTWDLGVRQNETTGFNDIAWIDGSGNAYDITNDIGNGSLKALVDVRDQYLGNGFIKDVNELAKALITQTNSIHETGYNLNGTTNTPFFEDLTGDYAKNMDLSTAIKNDTKNIAATSSTSTPTGNDVALGLAALGEGNVVINGGQTTFASYVSSIVGHVGELTKNAKAMYDYEQNTMTVMEKQRESVSGVSIDDEMANLMKFQYAYQASARLFTVADQLFQTLLDSFK